MIKTTWTKQILNFITLGGTSRGVLSTKPSWFIKIYDTTNPDAFGIGECSIIPGLSPEFSPDYEKHLIDILSNNINDITPSAADIINFPSIRFGLETALNDLKNKGRRILYPSEFTLGNSGIPINGLIWMGNPDYMKSQIEAKINQGFNCLKMKIGAIGFDDEIEIIKMIRKSFSINTLELRVDANGAFRYENVQDRLKELAKYDIHSIEQPIKQGYWEEMAKLCQTTPIPIALDEELIGISEYLRMNELLTFINPQFIILKPSLLGGFTICDQWIELAQSNKIGWWITSALEGNIGLNAIAQWTFMKKNPSFQGLGTGQLYSNNIPSPLVINGNSLFHNPKISWDLSNLKM